MKTIIFDFDGTLTYKSPNIWKTIWQNLGYDVGQGSYYRQLFADFMANKITHQQWCDLTCESFVNRGMTNKHLNTIAENIRLIDGFEDTIKALKQKGYSLHIVSGNIIDVIEKVLGENVKYFDTINANDMSFDCNDRLTYIKGTNYDFEGKARFINEYKAKTNSTASEITFVGNGGNDEWAHLSGCKTLCINPDDTDGTNKTRWHKTLNNVIDLTQILPELLTKQEQNLEL